MAAPRQIEISVRKAADRGGPVACRVAPPPDVLDASRHALLLVHGFNNTHDQAAQSYATILGLLLPKLVPLSNPPDTILTLQWPGDVAIGPSESLDFLGYASDISQALVSAQRLAAFLRDAVARSGGSLRISTIGHSLGCRLILEAMRELIGTAPSPFYVVALMAAAVPTDLVDLTWSGGADLEPTAELATTLLKFHSFTDPVLGLAFPAGQTLAYAQKIERAEFLEAVGYWGAPASFGQSISENGDLHGSYWSDKDVVSHIADALAPGFAPAQIATRTIAARPLPPANKIASRQLPTN
jgi:hypothetical protein